MIFATNRVLPLLFCLLFYNSYSQVEFESYTKNDGLTSSNILITKVDSKGRVWLGTANGVSVYSSDTMVSIKNISDNQDYSKNIGSVKLIFETSTGEIWIGSEKGIFIFNGSYWTYFNDTENDDFVISDIFEDKRGWVWVMYEKYSSLKDVGNIGFSLVEGIIQMYNGLTWHKFTGQIGGSATITIGDDNIYFTSHIQDTKGNIWVTSQDGTFCFGGKEWIEYNEDQLPSDICNQVIESFDSTMWVAAKYGIARLINNSWVKFEKVRGIKDNTVKSLFLDKENRIWAVINKDNRFKYICYYENGKWNTFSKDVVKLKGDIKRILDFNGKIVAFGRKGVSEFNGKKWTNLLDKYKVGENHFFDFLVAKDKSIWFTGRNGIYHLTNDKFERTFTHNRSWKANCLFQSSIGDIWIGTEKQGVFRVTANSVSNLKSGEGLTDNHIKAILEDNNKRIWIVTKTGVSKYIE
jgi:ligand-binding sensor domain-containing protein